MAFSPKAAGRCVGTTNAEVEALSARRAARVNFIMLIVSKSVSRLKVEGEMSSKDKLKLKFYPLMAETPQKPPIKP